MTRRNRRARPDAAKPLDAPRNCSLCPRLAGFRARLRREHPSWHNAPVPAFVPLRHSVTPGATGTGRLKAAERARLLVVGLAPGKAGANCTGRVFTGDHAGIFLYAMLREFGFSSGEYGESADDGLELRDCVIANAVACVPPQNKPNAAEIAACRVWLAGRIDAMRQLRAIVALGRIAHESVLRVFGVPLREMVFRHGARHVLEGEICLFDSYHCSRYNMNTGRLRKEMLRQVFAAAKAHVDAGGRKKTS